MSAEVRVAIDDVVEHLVTFTGSLDVRAGAKDVARRRVVDALERWIREGDVRVTGDDEVDPVACVNTMKRRGRSAAGDPLWDAYVATGRGLVDASEARGKPDLWCVKWRRTIPREALSVGSSGEARVRVPLALTARHGEVTVTDIEGRGVVRTRRNEGTVDVILRDVVDAADVTVTSTFRDGDTEVCAGARATEGPRAGLATVTPFVRSFVERLEGDTVDGVWRFLFHHGISGSLHHHELDAADALRSVVEGGVFDCYAGAALIVASCQARGIPARIASGVGLYREAPFQHFWAEVGVAGVWQPFDVMCWDLAAGRLDDEAWSRRFYGTYGARMTTQRLPDAPTGAQGFKVPRAWYLLARLTEHGTAQSMHDAETGRLVCRDEISIDWRGC